MRERMNHLANGILDREMPIVVCEPSSLDLPVKVDEEVRLEIIVRSTNGLTVKGVAYSDNIRVRVAENTFGGTKNKILMDVFSHHLPAGYRITGNLILVTNGGEIFLPYTFRVVVSPTHQTLASLKTLEDFVKIAREDFYTARKIFEYKDFLSSPFMKDLRLQKLYRAFLAGEDRDNALEQFLISAGGKREVHFLLQEREQSFEVQEGELTGKVRIFKSDFGLLHLYADSLSPFISLSKTEILNQDFIQDAYTLTYRIETAKLSPGKNTAAIVLRSPYEEQSLKINLYKGAHKETDQETLWKRELAGFMRLSIEAELSQEAQEKRAQLLEKEKALEGLLSYPKNKDLFRLLQAECYLELEEVNQAKALLASLEARMQELQGENVGLYLLFEYLKLQIKEDEEKRESLRELCTQAYESQPDLILFLLMLRLDDRLSRNPMARMEFIQKAFAGGNRSPFLLMAYLEIVNRDPSFLRELDELAVLALHFGTRHRLISYALAGAVTDRARYITAYHRLLLQVLTAIFEYAPSRPLLESVCFVLIKGDVRESYANGWYRRGLENQISLPRLNEYFILSLPRQISFPIPEEAIHYFEGHPLLEDAEKMRVYENIVEYYSPASRVYRSSIQRIRIFALDQAVKLKVNSSLAGIYERVFTPEMVDERMAKILPFLCNSFEIRAQSALAKNAVVIYPELKEEKVYPLEQGAVFAAIYSEEAMVLFEDAKGNRYHPGCVSLTRVLNMPQLLERAYALDKNHDMLRLKRLDGILKMERVTREDAALAEGALDMDLDPGFRSRVFEKLISYYWESSENKTDTRSWTPVNYAFLREINEESLDAPSRFIFCDTLINIGYTKEAFQLVKEYGIEELSLENMARLTAKIIEEKLPEPIYLSLLAGKVFQNGYFDRGIMEYLTQNFHGSTGEMVELLLSAVENQIETYDLEERILSQMLFTGLTDQMDEVFALYVSRKKANETLARAYFTQKSMEYFLEGQGAPDQVFSYLQSMAMDSTDFRTFPLIYQLALTLYYSRKQDLDYDSQRVCRGLLDYLMRKGYLFSYFKELAKNHGLWESLENTVVFQYTSSGKNVTLRSRILPDQRDWETEKFLPMYENIYVKEKILFAGDVWEYEIIEEGAQPEKVLEGKLYPVKEEESAMGRFSSLNRMGELARVQSQALKPEMEDYMFKQELTKLLFRLL